MSLEEIFIARQPIFNRKEKLWGYELLFRSGKKLNQAGAIDDEVATGQVLVDGFKLAFKEGLNLKYLINFSEKSLLEEHYNLLPSQHVVLEILERVNPTPKLVDCCKKIKKQGYVLAVDDYVGQEEFKNLIAIADIVKVDILELYEWELEEIVTNLKKYKVKLLAEKVETREKFLTCLELGFDYFQGFFFSKPEILEGKKLSSSEVSKLKILKEISKPEISFKGLSEIIKQDINLTYRLIKYINSPYFGFKEKISSLQRALTCLGEKKIKQWLRVVLLADLSTEDRGKEVVFLSAFRGRFLQLLAEKVFGEESGEKFFLLGLLSYLDVLLQKSLSEIVEELFLDEDIKKGLLDPEHPYHQWLVLASYLEKGEWRKVGKQLTFLKIDPTYASECLNAAYLWVNNLLKSE